MPVPHYHVVAAIIRHEGNILCVQKGVSKYAYISHRYEFPGGKVEPGESPQSALHREVQEEICLDIRIDEWYYTVTHEYPDFRITMEAYLCSAMRIQSLLLTEHIHHQWLPATKLAQLDWAAADWPIVIRLAGTS